jgi:hypothetical protein
VLLALGRAKAGFAPPLRLPIVPENSLASVAAVVVNPELTNGARIVAPLIDIHPFDQARRAASNQWSGHRS